MREGRIRHPAGALYLKFHLWAAAELGHAAAAALAAIEFRDRLNHHSNEWFELSVPQIVEILGGLWGRDKILAGLRKLEACGWVCRRISNVFAGQLWRKKVEIQLCADEINRWIEESLEKSEACDYSASGNSKNQLSGGENSSFGGSKNRSNKQKGVNSLKSNNITEAIIFEDGSVLRDVPAGLAEALRWTVSRAKNRKGNQAAYAFGILHKASPAVLLARWSAFEKARADEELRRQQLDQLQKESERLECEKRKRELAQLPDSDLRRKIDEIRKKTASKPD